MIANTWSGFDFGLGADIDMLRETVRRFSQERIAPRAAEIDESHAFPWDVVELFRDQGIFGVLFDEEVGGTGTGTLLALVAIEEVSKVCATSGLILAVQELGSLGLKLGGTDEQREAWLPRLASGEVLCAYALTEAGSGSDSAAMRRGAQPGLRHPRPRGGARGHLRVPRRGRRAGVRGRAARGEDGHRRLDDG
jgi:alkylation response protein AidB-like acyl-CoA dehydrogenase